MRPTTTLSILLFVALHIGSAQTVIEDRWVLADGGSEYDWLDDIAVDDSGNVYFCATLEGGSAIAIGRLTPDLDRDWIVPTSFGDNFGYCVELVVDSSSVYVASNSGAVSNSNAVIYRYNKSTGARTFTYYNNVRNTHDHITDLVLDQQGNVIIAGTSYYKSDSSESFILKYNTHLTLLWGKTYVDRIVVDKEWNDVAVDDSGNVFVTGKRTMKFSAAGELQWTQLGADGMVVDSWGRLITAVNQASSWMIEKYDRDGSNVWGMAYEDGTTMGPIVKMIIDDVDNVYICGTKSWPNTLWHTVKMNALGTTMWSADVASPAGNKGYVYDLAVDRKRNVYVTGTVVDVPGDNFMSAVTVRYDPTGVEVWRQKYGVGNSHDEYGACIAVDESLSVVVGGFRSQTEDRYTGDLLVWKYQQRDRFTPIPDGWQFRNARDPMWQAAWWMQFDYSQPPYPAGWVSWPIFAMPFDWPDWPVFVRAFGEVQCYINPLPGVRVYNPVAVRFWRSLVQGAKYSDAQNIRYHWKGSCYGFSLSSLLFYNGQRHLPKSFPGYERTYDVPSSVGESLNMIHSYQLYQFGYQQQISRRAAHKKPLTTSFDEIDEMLRINRQNTRILEFFNNNGPGGHAVVPCSLATVGPDLIELYIYDCNYPGTDQVININPTQWTWEYPRMPGWGGASGLVLSEPVDYVAMQPILPLPTKGVPGIIVFSTPEASSVIENPKGERLGFIPDGPGLLDSIPNAGPIIPLTGTESPPIGYTLPDDDYHITISGVHDSAYTLTLFSDSTSFAMSRADCAEDETDILTSDPGLRRLRYQNADAAQKVLILDATSSLPGRAMSCRLTHMSVGSSDSLDLGIKGADRFEIRNYGPGKTYDLRLEYAFEPGYRVFEHAGIVLDSSHAHLLAPDWEYMEDGPLPISIDRDGDGTPDDTMYLENEFVTGTGDQAYDLVPDEVFLDQNYPNPFNAWTTIRFGIPEQSHVRISIYNLLGQEVAVLADGLREAGYSSIRWNAAECATGIYVCRLQAVSTRDPARRFAKSIRLLLVK
jgi:hypothetical protein